MANVRREYVLGAIAFLALLLVWKPLRLVDFAAFACAGQAVAHHLDPYDQVGTLASCEQHIAALTGEQLMPGLIVPAPLPPYALALFALFAFLSSAAAAVVWLALLAVAYLAIVIMLQRLTHLPWALIVAATVIPIVRGSIDIAQVVPVMLATIVASAAAVRSGRPLLASCCALLALIEPHLGLPVCVALFCIERAARFPLLGGGLLLVLVSLVATPLQLALHYGRDILPLHAYAGLMSDSQMSLSHALAVFGVSAHTALLLGSAQYLFMLVLGTALAVRIARDPHERDLALLTAPTFAMFGGSFVHVQQIAVASCCLVLLLRSPKQPTYLLDTALILLATPLVLAESPHRITAYVLIAVVISVARKHSLLLTCFIGLCMFALTEAVDALKVARIAHLVPREDALFIPHYNYGFTADIETVWHGFVTARLTWLGPTSLLVQAPTLIALSLICIVLVRRFLADPRGIAHAVHLRSGIATLHHIRSEDV